MKIDTAVSVQKVFERNDFLNPDGKNPFGHKKMHDTGFEPVTSTV